MTSTDEALAIPQIERLGRIADAGRSRLLTPDEAMDVEAILLSLNSGQEWEKILLCYDQYRFLNRQQGHRDLARTIIDSALTAAKKLNRKDAECAILHDLAEIHMQQGRNEIANRLFLQSYQLHMDLQDNFGVLKSKHMSVLARRAMGRKWWKEAQRSAMEVLSEAQNLAKCCSEAAPWVAHPLELLSIFADDVGDYDEEERLLGRQSEFILITTAMTSRSCWHNAMDVVDTF